LAWLRSTRHRVLLLVAIGVVVLAAVGVVTLTGSADAPPKTTYRLLQPPAPKPQGLGPPVFPGKPTDVTLFTAGVCHSEEGQVVPCAGVHHSEDYASFTIVGSLGPGGSALRSDASGKTAQVIEQTCNLLFVQ
jgi:hypothetical protein